MLLGVLKSYIQGKIEEIIQCAELEKYNEITSEGMIMKLIV